MAVADQRLNDDEIAVIMGRCQRIATIQTEGRDESNYYYCEDCERDVCHACVSICTHPLCGSKLCRECKPNAFEPCVWHPGDTSAELMGDGPKPWDGESTLTHLNLKGEKKEEEKGSSKNQADSAEGENSKEDDKKGNKKHGDKKAEKENKGLPFTHCPCSSAH